MTTQVEVRAYDISMGMARTMSGMVGLNYDAIYHTGIHVFGKEYFFGGGVGSGSGISSMPPRDFERSFNIRPIETIRMGTTTKTQSEFEAWIRQITPQWACNTYVVFECSSLFFFTYTEYSNTGTHYFDTTAIISPIRHFSFSRERRCLQES